jgi:hypothetical protein
MPVGTALAGPVAAAVGTQAALLAMSAIGVCCALAFLAVRAVRELPRGAGALDGVPGAVTDSPA